MTVGEKIQFYRKQKNLSQEQLGERLFVSRQTVSLWEKDQTLPTIDNLLKLKEIFGVSVDDLLSGDAEVAQEAGHNEKEPLESFTVIYQKADARRATMGAHKRYMVRLVISSVCMLVLCVISLMEGYTVLRIMTGTCFLLLVALTVKYYFRVKSIIRTSEQQTANNVYHYEIYKDYIEQTVSRNGEEISTRKMPFSELTNIQQHGDLLIFQCGNQIFLVHMADLSDNSIFYRSLRARFLEENEEKKPKRRGGLTAVSILLFIFSIASLWIAVTIAATLSMHEPEMFYESLQVALYFLPIPIGSIVFGVLTQRKGYAYKKNIAVGIIMMVLLIIFGLFVR